MQSYGRYELLERLGRGGMAEVFLARMNGPMHVSRYVAIKRILPDISDIAELNAMFLDEIRVVVQLSHPSIGAVHDFGVEGGCIYLAMELVEGQDVRSLLGHALKGQPIPLECALYIAAQVARALDYAHKARDAQERSLGIVHRDITPSNILVSYRGDVKLVDFGIARAASHVRMHHSTAGELKGTIRYMSPEQAAGKELDWRSDLFSLTTVLLEMVIGHPVFKAESDVKALKLVQEGRAPERDAWAERIPDDVAAIIDRGMQVESGGALRLGRGDGGGARAGAARAGAGVRAGRSGAHDGSGMRRGAAAASGAPARVRRERRRRVAARARGGSDEGGGCRRAAHARGQGADERRGAGAGGGRGGEGAAVGAADRRGHGAAAAGGASSSLARRERRGRGRRRRARRLVLACGVGAGDDAAAAAGGARRRDAFGGAAGTADAAAVARAAVAADAAAPAAAPTGFGTLNLQSSPWANVTVDGKSVGETPLVGLRLAAGRHRVTLANPGLPARTIKVVVPLNASIDQRVTLTD